MLSKLKGDFKTERLEDSIGKKISRKEALKLSMKILKKAEKRRNEK